jgi:hypothetical protein
LRTPVKAQALERGHKVRPGTATRDPLPDGEKHRYMNNVTFRKLPTETDIAATNAPAVSLRQVAFLINNKKK